MKCVYWILLSVVGVVVAATGFAMLWGWFHTAAGQYTLEGFGLAFQLAGVALVIWDLRRGSKLGQNIQIYDRLLPEIERIVPDIDPRLPAKQVKTALATARSRVVQDDLVAHASVVWISWFGPIFLTLGILLTGAATLFGIAPTAS